MFLVWFITLFVRSILSYRSFSDYHKMVGYFLITRSRQLTNYLKHQFISLDTSLHRASAVVRRLLNGYRPINRIPPEILLQILMLVPKRVPFIEDKVVRYWPFHTPKRDDLRHLSRVCSHWRQITVGSPAFWSTYMESERFVPNPTFLSRCSAGPIDVYIDSSFSGQLEQLLRQEGPRIRQLHLHSRRITDGIPDRRFVVALPSLNLSMMEHCSLHLPPQTTRDLFSSSYLREAIGTNLRSLLLAVHDTLPQWELPALKHCVFRNPQFMSGSPIDICSLLKFLSGTPQLTHLHVYQLSIFRSVGSASPPPSPVALRTLKSLTYKSRDLDIPSFTEFFSHLLVPLDCQIDIDNIRFRDLLLDSDILSLVVSPRGRPSPTAVGMHVKRYSRKRMQVLLELPGEVSPDGPTRTVRLRFRVAELECAYFWDSLVTPEFCSNISVFRLDIRETATQDEIAAGLAMLSPVLSQVRKLSVAFPWRVAALRQALESLTLVAGTPPVCPALDTLDVYVDMCTNVVMECLAELLASRITAGCRVRRFVLCSTTRPDYDVASQHVDEFAAIRYKSDTSDAAWTRWPSPRASSDASLLIGTDWPTW